MYEVLLGSQILYYPGSDDYVIYDTELNLEVGSAGEFLFKVPSSNPLYNSLSMGTLVTILKNGAEYWRGEIRDIKIDFAKVADVYCLEDLAWLGEEYMVPAKVINQTYTQRFTTVVTTYNANRSNDRKFTVGYVYNGSGTCNWRTEYEWSILDSIRNCICRDDYYVRVRRVTNGGTVTRYLDVVRLEDYGVAANQPIEYGYNLLDYVKDSDYGNLVNVLTPYGDVKTDAADNPVYVYDDYMEHIQGTTISNQASITAYGRHAKAVVFDGVTNVTSLNNLASAYLARYCQPQLTMEVSAVDLAEIENVDAINIGDSVLIIAKPFAVNQRLYLTQMTIDLQNIAKNKITLSGHVARRTLTNQLQTAMDAVEELPVESDILMTAKRNALAMLLDETQGGHVVFEYDASNKYVEAINICNGATIAASTKRWRWSQNGFGYMERANTSAEWSGATAKIAITMNGAIVADYITTGTMSATRMRGGTLALGGTGQGAYKSGSLYIYDANSDGTAVNNLIGSWTSSGISVKAGTITLGNKATRDDDKTGIYIGSDGIGLGVNSPFHVTSDGSFRASVGTIGGFTLGTDCLRTNDKTSTANGSLAMALYAGRFERTILNAIRSNLQFAIGSKFGVDSTGKIYAAEGIFGGELSAASGSFTGSVTATSGAIGDMTISGSSIGTVSGGLNNVFMSKTLFGKWNQIGGSWGGIEYGTSGGHLAWPDCLILWTPNQGTGYVCMYGSPNQSNTGQYTGQYPGSFEIVSKNQSVAIFDQGFYERVVNSDKRLKQDIKDLDDEKSKDFIMAIEAVSFRFNDKSALDNEKVHFGFIAQDVKEEAEEIFAIEDGIVGDEDERGYYSLNYNEIIAPLVKLVQNQQKEIDLLKEEIKAMKEVING